MTGKTHRQYAMWFAYIAVVVLYYFRKLDINFYLAMVLIVEASKIGAIFPDLDHDWSNIGVKTPVNKIINILIHCTGGKHRSWQTHSVDIYVVCIIAGEFCINRFGGIFNSTDITLIRILWIGFMCGWASHLISDMLTSAGIRIICFSNIKIKIVPKKIGKLRFCTGEAWEEFNYKVMRCMNTVVFIIAITFPIFESSIIKLIIK